MRWFFSCKFLTFESGNFRLQINLLFTILTKLPFPHTSTTKPWNKLQKNSFSNIFSHAGTTVISTDLKQGHFQYLEKHPELVEWSKTDIFKYLQPTFSTIYHSETTVNEPKLKKCEWDKPMDFLKIIFIWTPPILPNSVTCQFTPIIHLSFIRWRLLTGEGEG